MKNGSYKVALLSILALGTTSGCFQKANKGEKKTNDSIVQTKKLREDSINNDKKVINLIKRMYNDKLYKESAFLKKHCTAKFLKRLKDDGYDTMELYWPLFTSEAQDGSGEKHGIVNVEPIGNGWFKYRFYDIGDLYDNKIKVVMDGKDIKFDEVEHISDGKGNEAWDYVPPDEHLVTDPVTE